MIMSGAIFKEAAINHEMKTRNDNSFKAEIPKILLLRKREEDNGNTVYDYQYRCADTGEILYYTVTAYPKEEYILSEIKNKNIRDGARLICSGSGEYMLLGPDPETDILHVIRFTIQESENERDFQS